MTITRVSGRRQFRGGDGGMRGDALRDDMRRREAILVEAVTEPGAGVPRISLPLQVREFLLRVDRGGLVERMGVLEFGEERIGARRELRIEGAQQRCLEREPLELVEPVA